MEFFFHGWLISIGRYVEKLIKHDCFKGGKKKALRDSDEVSRKVIINKAIQWLPAACRCLTNSMAACGGGKVYLDCCQMSRKCGAMLSISTFMLFSRSTLPPVSPFLLSGTFLPVKWWWSVLQSDWALNVQSSPSLQLSYSRKLCVSFTCWTRLSRKQDTSLCIESSHCPS